MIYSEAANTFGETFFFLTIGGPMFLWRRPYLNIRGKRKMMPQPMMDILRRLVFGMWLGNLCFLAVFYSLNQPIFSAIKANDLEMAKRILDEHRELARSRAFAFVLQPTNITPLHLAASSGNIALIKVLLDAGADVDAADHTDVDAALEPDLTPLVNAVVNGHLEAVELLIAAGADVNAICGRDKSTPIMFSNARNNLDMTKLLLEHGAKWEIPDRNGIDALQYAQKEGHTDIVRLMTQK